MAAPDGVVGVEGGSSETAPILSDSTTGDEKRPQFGTRFLTDPRQVFQHNAWWVILYRNPQEERCSVCISTRDRAGIPWLMLYHNLKVLHYDIFAELIVSKLNILSECVWR